VVLEMGTNRPGEISRLAEIAAPDVGVVTNVARTHLEGLKSIEGVAKAKAELVHALSAGGFAILNADDPEVIKFRSLSEATVVTFGVEQQADVFAGKVARQQWGFSFLLNGTVETKLTIPGRHNVYNALAAVAVCRRLGLELEYLAGRLESFRLPPMRLERRDFRGAVLINDAYNANPESMAVAIEELSGQKGARKLLIFADMLELGEQSVRLHLEVGRRAAEAGIDLFWAAGDAARHAIEGAIAAGMPSGRARFFPAVEDLAEALARTLRKGDVALLKGSRGMKLERLFDLLE